MQWEEGSGKAEKEIDEVKEVHFFPSCLCHAVSISCGVWASLKVLIWSSVGCCGLHRSWAREVLRAWVLGDFESAMDSYLFAWASGSPSEVFWVPGSWTGKIFPLPFSLPSWTVQGWLCQWLCLPPYFVSWHRGVLGPESVLHGSTSFQDPEASFIVWPVSSGPLSVWGAALLFSSLAELAQW